MYNQEYESAASFWPDVHGRIISALVFSQLVLLGLMSTKGNAQSTPILIVLPVLTIWFHRFCKGRYEPAFVRHPLQVFRNSHIIHKILLIMMLSIDFKISDHSILCSEFQDAMMKDTLERAREPNLSLKSYLQNAYIHPMFKNDDDDEDGEDDINGKLEESVLVPTKRQSRRNTPVPSKYSGGSSPSLPDAVPENSES